MQGSTSVSSDESKDRGNVHLAKGAEAAGEVYLTSFE